MIKIIPDPRYAQIAEEFRKSLKKLIAVLYGGGALGAFEFGVLLFLFDVGLLPLVSTFIGTSAGGLNALIVSKYLDDLWKCKKVVWDNIKKNEDIYERQINWYTIAWQFFTRGKSVLDPKGLVKLAVGEFGACTLQREVIVTATDMDDCIVDGGWGNNAAIDILCREGADRALLVGVQPDVPERRMIEHHFPAGKLLNATEEALETSAIPFMFPPRNKPGKDVRLPDMVKIAPGTLADLFEEWEWKYFELYQRLAARPMKKGECYPKAKLGNSDDYTRVQQWIEDGYEQAQEKFTPEYCEEWLLG